VNQCCRPCSIDGAREREKAGHKSKCVAVAFEAGRDGFRLARWLSARGIEAHVTHASSVAVAREHRRAKTDRVDTELLKRAFLAGCAASGNICKMTAIPTIAEEDARRPAVSARASSASKPGSSTHMKGGLRLGIRDFHPKLRKAADRLEELRTPDGEPSVPRLGPPRLVTHEIRQIEAARLERLSRR
jgi:transposase